MKLLKSILAFSPKKESEIRKVGINTLWLLSDRLTRMGVGLVVGVWIARYFGPDLFGTWNYILAFVGLFSTIATLGIDGIVVRDLTLNQGKVNYYLGSSFGLRLISGICSVLLCFTFSFILNNDEQLNFILINILSVTLILQAFDVVDLYFQSVTKSFYTVISKGIPFIIISVLKIVLILETASIIYFIWANIFEVFISSIFLIVALNKEKINFFNLKWESTLARKMLIEGWPLIIAGVLVMVYLKIDQIMLKELSNQKSVGIYSAAVRISEIWYFIPVVISSSIFPYLLKQREISQERYVLTLKRMYSLFFWVSLLIAIFINITSFHIVDFLYGKEYIPAAKVLSIHIWAGIFVFLGVASSQFLMAENIVKFSLYRTLIGAITNIILNFVFIPIFQEVGAAYATLISYFMSTFSLIFFKQCRQQCLFMLLAIVPSKKLFTND